MISTLLVVGILTAIGFGIRRFVLWNRREENKGWWKVWRWRIGLRDIKRRSWANGGETAPLLGDGGEG